MDFHPLSIPHANYSPMGLSNQSKRAIIDLLWVSCSRATVRTVWNDGLLENVPINTAAISNGALSVADSRTNRLLNFDSPATQTTLSLGTGFYNLDVFGSGSALASGATATITGAASATEGNDNTIEITVSGTVTVTVTGSLDYFQFASGSYPQPLVATSGAEATNAADICIVPIPNVLTPQKGAIEIIVDPKADNQGTKYVIHSAIDGSNELKLNVAGTAGHVFTKEILDINIFVVGQSYNYEVGVFMRYQIYWDEVIGVGIRVAAASADIGALSFITDPDTQDMPLDESLCVGNRFGGALFVGNYRSVICHESKEAAGW